MWRPFFLAIGISLGIVGGECLLVDEAVVTLPNQVDDSYGSFATSNRRREVSPPEWAPWSLLSAGAVISLYSLTLHRD
jgi:hypothetical protein